jgi:hypothetical protein
MRNIQTLLREIDFVNLCKLLLVPLVYYLLAFSDFLRGLIIGGLLASIYNDVSKYGFKRILIFPVSREVRLLEDLIQHGDIEAIKKIVSQFPHKHFVSMKMSQGYTPLIIAVDSRRRDIVNYVLDCGADINQYCKNETALHRAVFRNDLQITRDLIERGANVEARIHRSGITPALYSIIRGQPHMLDLLLEYGASMDITVNNKVVKDDIKNDPEIKAIFAKHERWRRVRKAFKFRALSKSVDANNSKKFKLTADQQR